MSKAKHEYLIVRRPMNVNELPDHELGDVIPFPVLMCKDLVPESKAWACYMFIKEITQDMIDLMDSGGKATSSMKWQPQHPRISRKACPTQYAP